MNIIVSAMMKMLFRNFLLPGLFVSVFPAYSQIVTGDRQGKDRQVELRGELNSFRSAYDVSEYHLDIKFDLENKSIIGVCQIIFRLNHLTDWIQVDLFENMQIEAISLMGSHKKFKKEGNAIFVESKALQSGVTYSMVIQYTGRPIVANHPPWDGGFIWSQDALGRPWVSVACEGLGASSWWPNKDHLSDEPDRMTMAYNVPDSLMAISNGRLQGVEHLPNNRAKYTWEVSYPINIYNATFYIGAYDHFKCDFTTRERQTFDLDFYVLDYELEKAKKHFNQVDSVLIAFEHFLGPYPFARDGYALVEAPYAGMEHQSAIAYGNQYMRGYLGQHIPSDLSFDYIIVHETGHEYWGNSVSARDHGEMWLHESFTTYMEALYVEYMYDYDMSVDYLSFQSSYILNQQPMLGPLDINYLDNDTDIYYKGSWVLHTLRQLFDSEESWFRFLKHYYEKYAYGFVDTQDFISDLSNNLGRDCQPIVEQYLRHEYIPVLLYRMESIGDEGYRLAYRWANVESDFAMPLKIKSLHKEDISLITPALSWQTTSLSEDQCQYFLKELEKYYLIELRSE